MAVGFLLTTAYRYLMRQRSWKNWTFLRLSSLILVSTLLLTLLMMGGLWLFFGLVFDDYMPLASFLSNMAIFGLVMLCWNMMYFYVHYFNSWHQSEIDKWILLAEMKDAQLGSLKSQINPHFVFNTLNNIRSLIREDREKARDMLLNFSDLFRYALKNNDLAQVAVADEIEIVQQYLELVSIQYEDKLRYELSVEPGLEEVKLPPMMLQLLVENAIKHGISQYVQGGDIYIDLIRSEERMEIVVKNTGQMKGGTALGEKLGVGLENIRKRLELIYNGRADFSMQEKSPYVIASISIPLS
ncbi:MAG: histidine kinase [Bacteroidota bacterium]